MLVDLGLYLNNNPTDQKALGIHDKVANDAQKMRNAYEQSFGALCMRSEYAGTQNEWQWIKDPWPWEAAANFDLN
jgi:spore coat protein JB